MPRKKAYYSRVHAYQLIGSLFFFALLWSTQLCAQQLTITTGALFHIGQDAMVTVKSNMTNDGTLNMDQSVLTVDGNWTGTGTHNFNQETLVLAGANQQEINYDLEGVVSNMHVKGGGLKKINQPLEITTELWLEKGIVELPATEIFKLSGMLKEGNGESFVRNKMTRMLETSTTDALFPIGTTQYFPAQLSKMSATTPFEITMEVHEVSPNIPIQPELETTSEKRYWSKTQVTPNTPILGQISLFLNVDEAPITLDNATLMAGDAIGNDFEVLGRGAIEGQQVVSEKNFLNQTLFAFAAEKDFKDLDCIPNVFASSAEKVEDQKFMIQCPSLSEEDFNISIFNKWGTEVWNTNELSKITTEGWDGTSNDGNPLPPDVYEYVTKGKYTNGSEFLKQGVVIKLD